MTRIRALILVVLCAVGFAIPAGAEDRQITYPAQIPLSTQVNQRDRFIRNGVGSFWRDAMGTLAASGTYGDLSVVPNGGMNVAVQPSVANSLGTLYQTCTSDVNPIPQNFATQLSADATQIVCQGTLASSTGSIGPMSAPSSGLSQYYLLEGKVNTTDTTLRSIQFQNSVGSSSFASVNTVRCDCMVWQLKAGTAAASPAVPSTDSGWVAVAKILVPSGAASITSGMITQFPAFQGFVANGQSIAVTGITLSGVGAGCVNTDASGNFTVAACTSGLGTVSGTPPIQAQTVSGVATVSCPNCVSSMSAVPPLSVTSGNSPQISISGVIPINKGGTGSSSQNFVDTTTAGQSIAVPKTWSGVQSFTSSPFIGLANANSNTNVFFFGNPLGGAGKTAIGSGAANFPNAGGIAPNVLGIANSGSGVTDIAIDGSHNVGLSGNLSVAGYVSAVAGLFTTDNIGASGFPASSSGVAGLGWNASNGGGEADVYTGYNGSLTASFYRWNGSSYQRTAYIDSSGQMVYGTTGATTVGPTGILSGGVVTANVANGTAAYRIPGTTAGTYTQLYAGGASVAGVPNAALGINNTHTGTPLVGLDESGNLGIAGQAHVTRDANGNFLFFGSGQMGAYGNNSVSGVNGGLWGLWNGSYRVMVDANGNMGATAFYSTSGPGFVGGVNGQNNNDEYRIGNAVGGSAYTTIGTNTGLTIQGIGCGGLKVTEAGVVDSMCLDQYGNIGIAAGAYATNFFAGSTAQWGAPGPSISVATVPCSAGGFAQRNVQWLSCMDTAGNLGIAAYLSEASRRALKDHIRPLEPHVGLSDIMALRPVRFAYKAEHAQHATKIGIIADDSPTDIAGPKHDHYDITATITLLVQSVQDLKKENDSLRAEIERYHTATAHHRNLWEKVHDFFTGD